MINLLYDIFTDYDITKSFYFLSCHILAVVFSSHCLHWMILNKKYDLRWFQYKMNGLFLSLPTTS